MPLTRTRNIFYDNQPGPVFMASTGSDFSSIDSIPTPDHCTADFCLIPVNNTSPALCIKTTKAKKKKEKSMSLPSNSVCFHADRNEFRICLRADRRRPEVSREVWSQICDAFCRDNIRYVCTDFFLSFFFFLDNSACACRPGLLLT